MMRSSKPFWCVLLLGVGLQSASSFSFWGTREEYQEPVLGYERRVETDYPGGGRFTYASEFSYAPHNLGEEYRWSLPLLYYAFDTSFLDYFGSNGVDAVDAAFALMEKAFTNNPTGATTGVDGYSLDLSEVPLEATRYNYTAQALHLFDLKSATLEMLVTRLGLADPERWTWTIRLRQPLPGGCPFFLQSIIQRNFDPVTFEPSRYVNGNLFTYVINQHCPPDIRGDRVDAEEFLLDPLGAYQSAIASPKITFPRLINYGTFYGGLTRDDVAGLRYLYRTNNMNVETAPPGSVLFATNFNASQLLFTSNLTLLAAQALTNDAAALAALYPGLVIADTTPIFTNVITTNVIAYYTNPPWLPGGSLPLLVVATNYTTNVATWYNHTFANVVTNTWYTNGIFRLQTTTVGQCPWSPPGYLCTNVTSKIVATNLLVGDFYILPTNSDCGAVIVSTQLVTSFILTNDLVSATNTAGITNGTGTTNLITQQYLQSEITYFTNHIFVIHPVPCVTDSVALRQGLEKISFVRRDFDSLLGQFFDPITNIYTMTAITNNRPFLQRFRRVVTQPDILISAVDLVNQPHDVETVAHGLASAPSLNSSNAIAGLAGPGTFEGRMTLSFNKVGPIYLNTSPFYVDEAVAYLSYMWASFDGSTNAPFIYPSGTSIQNLERQILIQVSPSMLPPGTAGTTYTAALSVTGGQPPYTWSLTPGSANPLPGLTLTQNPLNSSQATLSAMPTAADTFEVLIRVTDNGSRFVDTAYLVVINNP